MNDLQKYVTQVVTAIVTAIGASIMPGILAYAKSKGIDSGSLENTFTLVGTVAIGAASHWVTGVLATVERLFSALNAILTGQIDGYVAKLQAKAAAANAAAPAPTATLVKS